MARIELETDDGVTVFIQHGNNCMTIDDYIQFLIRPALIAVGFDQRTVDDSLTMFWQEEDDNKVMEDE